MTQFTINNNHLTKIARTLGKEFNKIDFLNWYKSLNPKFNYNYDHMDRTSINKYFDGFGDKVKIFNLPEINIGDDEQLKNLLSIQHGFYREPLVSILKEEFNVDYWKETLRFCSNKDNKFSYSVYFGLLSHSMNDLDFTTESIELLKIFTEGFIDGINNSKSKYFSEVIQFLSFGINNKELFGNDWLIQCLNEVFKTPDKGESKQFNFYVDKISKQFADLDFNGIRINTEFKKVIKGKLPLTTSNEQSIPFFMEIDIPRYCMAHKVVQQLLQTNCIIGLEVIDRFLKDQPEVLSHFIKREKNKISLTVIHEDKHLNEKINSILDDILSKTKLNMMIDENDFEKSLLLITLKDTMVENNRKINNRGIKI